MNKSLKYLDYIAYIESGLYSISAKDPLKNRAKDSKRIVQFFLGTRVVMHHHVEYINRLGGSTCQVVGFFINYRLGVGMERIVRIVLLDPNVEIVDSEWSSSNGKGAAAAKLEAREIMGPRPPGEGVIGSVISV